MKNRFLILTLCLVILGLGSCKKDSDSTTDSTIGSKVLLDFPTYIAEANLLDLKSRAALLQTSVEAFVAAPSQANLQTVQQQWYNSRVAWEQSEAFLFGPVASFELDPAIDSWPVNFVDIDTVINQNATFPDAFIDSLNPTLKGFHPIEYLIFGKDGNRNFSELSAKQKDYLVALAAHLKRVTARMYSEWSVTGGNFAAQITLAGQAGSQYATKQAAVLEIVNAMTGIVEEVGTGKIEEPFVNHDASLEESPFAKNSFTDFKNNLTGVKNVYLGKYTTQGTGLSNFVQQYNKSLDLKIQQKIDAAISSLAAYTVPFGEAIQSQRAAVQSTQAVLADLQAVLENELVPLVQQNIK